MNVNCPARGWLNPYCARYRGAPTVDEAAGPAFRTVVGLCYLLQARRAAELLSRRRPAQLHRTCAGQALGVRLGVKE